MPDEKVLAEFYADSPWTADRDLSVKFGRDGTMLVGERGLVIPHKVASLRIIVEEVDHRGQPLALFRIYGQVV